MSVEAYRRSAFCAHPRTEWKITWSDGNQGLYFRYKTLHVCPDCEAEFMTEGCSHTIQYAPEPCRSGIALDTIVPLCIILVLAATWLPRLAAYL